MNVISLCTDLIRCKSITPNDDGALEYIAKFLSSSGFNTEILVFQSQDGGNVVKNLFAKHGNSNEKILGFVGHSDVVPAGDDWDSDPFSAISRDGFLIGRGVADMKGGIAAFCCAASKFVKQSFDGTIEFFITGDEEIGSFEGIRSLIKWAEENNIIPHDCLIGEPSSETQLGDRIYLGHRGSLNVTVKSHGKQGHSAYPSNYKNSLTDLCRYIAKISSYPWIYKDKRFPRTNAEATLLFTDNCAVNVVPERSAANLNVRFGADYTAEKLEVVFRQEAADFDGLSFDFLSSGEAYYCDDSRLKSLMSSSIGEVLGVNPSFSAAGGTSDGRYLANHCNVIEFGLPDSTIHQKNEKVKVEDLKNLEKIYLSFLKKYFAC
jgi:succinyl-diaminopimelate desuccinylase